MNVFSDQRNSEKRTLVGSDLETTTIEEPERLAAPPALLAPSFSSIFSEQARLRHVNTRRVFGMLAAQLNRHEIATGDFFRCGSGEIHRASDGKDFERNSGWFRF